MIDIPDPDTTGVPCPWHPIAFPESHLVLTPRQRAVLCMTREGMTCRQIAAVESVGYKYVSVIRADAYRILRAHR